MYIVIQHPLTVHPPSIHTPLHYLALLTLGVHAPEGYCSCPVCVCVCVCPRSANLRTGTTACLTEGIGSMSGTFVKLLCWRVRSIINLPGTKPDRVCHFVHVAMFRMLSISCPYS